MKKRIYIVLLTITIGNLASCDKNSPIQENPISTDQYDDYYEFQDFFLDDYDLNNVIISLPDETANIGAAVDPIVTHDESHKWEIMVGPKFELHIMDQGELNDLIQEEKDKLAKRPFNKITFTEESDSLLIYEKELIASGIESASANVGTEHKSYHIFGVRKIGEYNYVLYSGLDGVPDKNVLALMKKSILSFKNFNSSIN